MALANMTENQPKTRKTNHHPGWRKGVQEERRKAAEARQAERDKRTPAQQLAHLDSFLGVGKGATKERARLQAMISTKKEG